MKDDLDRLSAGLAADERWAAKQEQQRNLDADEGKMTFRRWLIGDPWPWPEEPSRLRAEVALKRLILHEHTPLEVEELLEGAPSHAHAHMLVVCEGCSVLPSPLQSGVAREYLLWPCCYILALQAIYPEGGEV